MHAMFNFCFNIRNILSIYYIIVNTRKHFSKDAGVRVNFSCADLDLGFACSLDFVAITK